MAVSFVPYNTKKNNDWARKNFITWCDARNAVNPDNKCPEGLLKKVPFDVDVLAYWLPRYAPETRTKTGKKYPASPFCVYLGPYCVKCSLYPLIVQIYWMPVIFDSRGCIPFLMLISGSFEIRVLVHL